MTTATVDIELREKLERFRQAMLSTVPGITEEGAEKAAKAWEKNYYTKQARKIADLENDFEKAQRRQAEAAEKAAKEAAKASEKAAEAQHKAWDDTAKKLATIAGGEVAEFGEALLELIPKAKEAGASVGTLVAGGVAVAGLAAGWYAAAEGVLTIAENADEAEERLLEAGLAAEIPQAARTAIGDYRNAMALLRNETDLLAVSLGAEAVEAVTSMTTAAAGAAFVLRGLDDLIVELRDDVAELVGGSEFVQFLEDGYEATEFARQATDLWEAGIKRLTGAVTTLGLSIPTEAFYRIAEAAGVSASEAEKASKGMSEAARDYAESQAEIDDDIRKGQEKLYEDWKKKREQIAAEDELAGEAEKRRQQQAAAEWARVQDQRVKAHQAALRDMNAAHLKFDEEQRKRETAYLQALADTQRTNAELQSQIASEAADSKIEADQRWAEEGIKLHQQQWAEFERLAKEQAELDMELMGATLDATAALAGIREESFAKEVERNEERLDMLDDRRSRLLDEIAEARKAEDEAREASLRADLVATDKKIANRRRALRQAAAQERQAAIFGILANAGEAVLKAFALFGPPPSPVGIASAAAAGLAAGEQIAALPPLPSAFRGLERVQAGADGSAMHELHQNEAVIPSNVTAELGPDTVRALVEGRFGGGGDGGSVVLDGEQVGRVLARRIAAGGALSRAVHGAEPVGYRSPYGG